MLGNADVNSLEAKKINLEIELNELINNNGDQDKISELRSEILYLKKQIGQKLGTKEVESQEKIKRKKLGVDERAIKNYNGLKKKYKPISKIDIATKNILKVIDIYLNQEQYEYYEGNVKVMSR